MIKKKKIKTRKKLFGLEQKNNKELLENKKRIYQIDLIRFLCALCVVFYHYTYRGPAIDKSYINIKFPELGEIFKYGYLGVDVFFIISGFVILMSIKYLDYKKFVRSRVTRLYPAYWFCLLITTMFVVLWGANNFSVNLTQLLANATMFNGFFRVKHVDGVYWTLFVELRFYILILLYIIYTVYVKRVDLLKLIYVWIFILVVSLFFEQNMVYKILDIPFLLNYGAYFIAGMLFYKIWKEQNSSRYVIPITITFIVASIKGLEVMQKKEIAYQDEFNPYIIVFVIMSLYLLFYLIALNKLTKFNIKRFESLGVLTYPLYLIHQYVGYILINKFENTINKYLLLFLLIISMLMFSVIIHRYIEKPLSFYLRIKMNKLLGIQ